jgi:hypothetical protein
MAPVEKYIVSLMEQMAKMRQPLNISEGLSLANSLIEGTEWEDVVVKFKSKRGWNPMAKSGIKTFGSDTATCLKERKGTSFRKIDPSGPFITTLSKCTMKFMMQW